MRKYNTVQEITDLVLHTFPFEWRRAIDLYVGGTPHIYGGLTRGCQVNVCMSLIIKNIFKNKISSVKKTFFLETEEEAIELFENVVNEMLNYEENINCCFRSMVCGDKYKYITDFDEINNLLIKDQQDLKKFIEKHKNDDLYYKNLQEEDINGHGPGLKLPEYGSKIRITGPKTSILLEGGPKPLLELLNIYREKLENKNALGKCK